MECRFPATVERWDVWELACPGRVEGNPFTDYDIFAAFEQHGRRVRVRGFYDGDGVYRVRFMPQFEGRCRFEVFGSFSDERISGAFEVTGAGPGNHGPVRVRDGFHFAYEDGTPHFSFGTTCYAWALQSDERVARTLESLRDGPFNKVRFCILPKHYDYNLGEPRSYPYEGTPMNSSVLTRENFARFTGKTEGNRWDFARFNPEHFRHLEECVRALREMGIEADLIVMHPYDRWGFAQMTPQQDELYWRYVIARFAAFRNVWWSLANEYDLMAHKSVADWERIANLLVSEDPYAHLRSIHNCMAFYDHTRPWITHASIQRQDFYRTTEYVDEWRTRFGKPIVCDEIAYEGNIQHGWGNIGPRELTRRFWEAALRGGYAGHGETYLSEDGALWWSHGGALRGESPARIAFLRRILEEQPFGLCREPAAFDEVCAVQDTFMTKIERVKPYYLYYYGLGRPSFREFYLDDETAFQVDVIDTWNMTVSSAGIRRGRFRVELPGREYMAIRLRRVEFAPKAGSSGVEIGPASRRGLERIWEKNIAANPGDADWVRWRDERFADCEAGRCETYLVSVDGDPVGEGTLILSPDCGAIAGRTALADGDAVANINALRIEKPWEGQGYISRLVRQLEARARELGVRTMTIGVEAREPRNLEIYLHWGYRRLVLAQEEGGDMVLYYAKDL